MVTLFRIKSFSLFRVIFHVLVVVLLHSNDAKAQLIDGNAYMIGGRVEIAIHGPAGHEGTADWPGNHSRGGSDAVPYGFVANPQDDDWTEFNGDFFTAGVPENGFGIEINGVNYSNNAWNADTETPYLQEIPTAPGGETTYESDGGCITVEWEGVVAGVTINVKYLLVDPSEEFDLFYIMEITLTNNTATDLTDVYYYRNLDPDNNEPIGGTFITMNTIVSQPDTVCPRALVLAEQALPWPSYVGLGALGDNFRVSHGGFYNRSGSDIWNATGGLNGTPGDVEIDDKSISLAYKTDLAAGETVNFQYAIVLKQSEVEEALSRLYRLQYRVLGGGEEGVRTYCDKTTLTLCHGEQVEFIVSGPDTDLYDWTSNPADYDDNDTIIMTITEPGTYGIFGDPIAPCLNTGLFDGDVSLSVVIELDGPGFEILDPGLICGAFHLDSLEIIFAEEYENLNCVFLTTQPDSATQTEPAFDGPWIELEDEVWFMCGDTITDCFSWQKIDLKFVGPGSAGDDSTLTICGGLGRAIQLTEMISDSANIYGRYYKTEDFPGTLNDSTGRWDASGIYGTFVFWYVTEGLDTCQGDTAVFTINLLPPPNSRFDIEVNGYSYFNNGMRSTCILNAVEVINQSAVEDPGVIVSWEWDYGDGTTSDLEHPPPHYYMEQEVYGIRLTVVGDNGCSHTSIVPIKVYEEPEFDYIFAEPTCYGDSDGLMQVEYDTICYAGLIVEITDEEGNILNAPGESSVEDLTAGTYLITVYDSSGCSATEEVVMGQPVEMEIFYRYMHPACTGDSGWAVIDSVVGETDNNPVSFEWIPNPANIEGVDADSSYWMGAGDYTVIGTDTRGCMAEISFTLIDPPPFYFTEWGWDTAYCRLYHYQSGNGVVYAAAAGGVPNYTYEWTCMEDGSTSNNSTWGGRNPGDHRIDVTDAFGCVLTKIITVDSVNPIASFVVNSAQLNPNCEGTAPVTVEFTNTSRYFANPENPEADTLFFWDLDRTDEDDWIICDDFFEKFDTVYQSRGEMYSVDVCLIAFNKNGCKDTACKKITIWEPPVLVAPNVFTPNQEDGNNYFTFEHLQKGVRDFHCIIVNRWGVQVAELHGIDDFWDGTNYAGDQCPDGVYFYTYTAVADNHEKFSGQGTVTLLDSGRQ